MADAAAPSPFSLYIAEGYELLRFNPRMGGRIRIGRLLVHALGRGLESQVHVQGVLAKGMQQDIATDLRWDPIEEGAGILRGRFVQDCADGRSGSRSEDVVDEVLVVRDLSLLVLAPHPLPLGPREEIPDALEDAFDTFGTGSDESEGVAGHRSEASHGYTLFCLAAQSSGC